MKIIVVNGAFEPFRLFQGYPTGTYAVRDIIQQPLVSTPAMLAGLLGPQQNWKSCRS